jgi:hypothetical protein
MHSDQAQAADYDDPMCDRLGIAADVLRSFGSAFGGRHLAIVEGAVPSLLAPKPPVGIKPHIGTADLDFHLSLHLLDGETADYYQAIIAEESPSTLANVESLSSDSTLVMCHCWTRYSPMSRR